MGKLRDWLRGQDFDLEPETQDVSPRAESIKLTVMLYDKDWVATSWLPPNEDDYHATVTLFYEMAEGLRAQGYDARVAMRFVTEEPL